MSAPAYTNGVAPPVNGTSAGAMQRKKLMGYVGFANLPNQVHRKSVRKGFHFTAMVVGEYYMHFAEHTFGRRCKVEQPKRRLHWL